MREKEQLTQKINYLETEINARKKEIGFLKETLWGRDKEIADLKKKLSQLQQKGRRNNVDIVKHMATMDEKLQKARINIDELEGGIIFSVIKNEIKTEESQSEPQIFNGMDYFDLQPSWFDTLSNKFGCLKVDNSPVTARDLEAMKNVKSNLKLSIEAAKGKDYFDPQPSWFDTIKKWWMS